MLVAVVVGQVEAFDLGVKCGGLLVVVDRQLVAQVGERSAAGQIMRRRFRDGAADEVFLERLPRLAVDVGGLHEGGAGGVEGAERELPLGLLPELGDRRVRRRQRPHLGPHFYERVRRLLQFAAALDRRECCDIGPDQCAVEGRERHVGARRDQLDLDAHIGRDVGHGEQQALALRQLLLARCGKEQRRQAALDIGQLLAARDIVDLLLHQRQHGAHLDALGAEIFDQRLGERRMPVGAVRRGFAGRRGEGEQDALGPPDAAKPGLHVLVRGDGDHAARVVGLRGIAAARPERIVAAGVEDDQPDLGDGRDGLAHIFQRQRRGLQRIERGRIRIGRQQPVLARYLDAVAGKIDQRHIGAGAVVAEILERAPHPLEVAVGLQRHLEAELLQHVADRLGIVDGVVELADVLVAVLADDQRHAPFGQRRAGNEHEAHGDEDTQQQIFSPSPTIPRLAKKVSSGHVKPNYTIWLILRPPPVRLSGNDFREFDQIAERIREEGELAADVVQLERLGNDRDAAPAQLGDACLDVGHVDAEMMQARIAQAVGQILVGGGVDRQRDRRRPKSRS